MANKTKKKKQTLSVIYFLCVRHTGHSLRSCIFFVCTHAHPILLFRSQKLTIEHVWLL